MSRGEELARADVEFHEATADVYERVLEPIFRPYQFIVQGFLDSLAELPPGSRALDLGCGTGVMTVALAERGLTVDGIDHSPAMLALAEEKARQRGVAERVALQVGDVASLPFADDTFDVVTCQGLLHHLHHMAPCLTEMHRVLKPGGVFHLGEPCTGTTPTLRAWDAGGALIGRARAVLSPSRAGSRVDPTPAPDPGAEPIPDHEEAPIDSHLLSRLLDERGLDHRAEYWVRLAGIHRVPSARIQRWLLRLLAWPWRRRRGNILVVRGSKPARPRGRAQGS